MSRRKISESVFADCTDETRRQVARAVGKLALRIFERGQDEAGAWRAFNALLCASHLHPQLDEVPASKIGARLGASKALWSLECVFWRDTLGLPGIGNGTVKARRNSAAAIHQRNGTKPKGVAKLLKALARLQKELGRSAHEASTMTPALLEELCDRMRVLKTLREKLGGTK